MHFQHQEEGNALPELQVSSEKLGLKFFLGVLQRTATAMPALNRSVEIVRRHMQAILDRRAKRYLESLFPTDSQISVSSTPPTVEPATSEMQSQPPSQYGEFDLGPTPSGTGSIIVPSENGYPMYSSFNLEELPAFPGQNFNVGANGMLDQEITDPALRATLLGLDPHVTLHHDNVDWASEGYYLGDQAR